jgi:hypothetical protein
LKRPEEVRLKRFAVPRLVFNFGIVKLRILLQTPVSNKRASWLMLCVHFRLGTRAAKPKPTVVRAFFELPVGSRFAG